MLNRDVAQGHTHTHYTHTHHAHITDHTAFCHTHDTTGKSCDPSMDKSPVFVPDGQGQTGCSILFTFQWFTWHI